MNKTELLGKTARDDRERLLLSKLWDKMECARRGAPACTGFLSLAEQEAAARFLAAAGHPRHLFSGGWAEAERKVCALLPDWQEQSAWEPPYTALRCTWRGGTALSHRDILGAVMGAGLEREKVGDILVREGACDLFVFRELAPYLLQNLTGAGRERLSVEEVPLSAASPPRPAAQTRRQTVSSLRLDAVLAAGFSLPRSRAAGLIAGGKVELDHAPCLKADRTVCQGDVLTCRGLGRCVAAQVGGETKKGRISLVLERYV